MIDRPTNGAVLDRQTLNRTLLARQLLLERAGAHPLEVVGHVVGMQAQTPLDPYVGVWSRVRTFEPETLAQALLDRQAVRMTLQRATLHLVTSDDALRLRPALQQMLERAFGSSAFARALAGVEVEPVLARGIELVEQQPRTVAQLGAALATDWPDADPEALAYAVRYLVPLVQVTPRGIWGARMQPTLTTLTGWLGRPLASDADADAGEIVVRYLRAFGPATTLDIRTWSGLKDVRTLIADLHPRLAVYRDENGRELYDVTDGVFAAPTHPRRFASCRSTTTSSSPMPTGAGSWTPSSGTAPSATGARCSSTATSPALGSCASKPAKQC